MVNVMRQALLRAARNESLGRAVTGFGPTRRALDRFVAGPTTDDAVRVVGELQARGLDASVDQLVGPTTDPGRAATATEAYLEVLERLAAAGGGAGTDLTVRLAAIGGLLPGGLPLDHARAIGTAARNVGATLTIEPGQGVTAEATLELVAELRNDFPATGIVLAANLRRTEADVQALAPSGARVRLIRGPEDDSPEVAYVDRHAIDRSFVRSLRILMESGGHPVVATQDPRLVAIALDLAQRNHRGPDTFELMAPLGLRATATHAGGADGQRLRILVPFGDDAWGHLVARLTEQPDDVAPVLRGLFARR